MELFIWVLCFFYNDGNLLKILGIVGNKVFYIYVYKFWVLYIRKGYNLYLCINYVYSVYIKVYIKRRVLGI